MKYYIGLNQEKQFTLYNTSKMENYSLVGVKAFFLMVAYNVWLWFSGMAIVDKIVNFIFAAIGTVALVALKVLTEKWMERDGHSRLIVKLLRIIGIKDKDEKP